jgi:hypothetical protein
VNPLVKYTLARVGLFAVVAAVLLVLPLPVHILLKLMIAVLVSAILALVLLRGMREEVAVRLSNRAHERAAEKERLRSALAGDDTAGDTGDESDNDGSDNDGSQPTR